MGLILSYGRRHSKRGKSDVVRKFSCAGFSGSVAPETAAQPPIPFGNQLESQRLSAQNAAESRQHSTAGSHPTLPRYGSDLLIEYFETLLGQSSAPQLFPN